MRITNLSLSIQELEQKVEETNATKWKIILEVMKNPSISSQRVADDLKVSRNYVTMVVSRYNDIVSTVEIEKDYGRHKAFLTLQKESELIASLKEITPINLVIALKRNHDIDTSYATAVSMLHRNGYKLEKDGRYMKWMLVEVSEKQVKDAAKKYEDSKSTILIDDDKIKVLDFWTDGDKVEIVIVDANVPLEQIQFHKSYDSIRVQLQDPKVKYIVEQVNRM